MLLLLLERKQNLSLCFPQRKIVPSSEAKFKTFLLPLYLLSPTESQIHQLKPTVSMNFKHPSPNFITQDLFLSDFAFFFSSELNHSFIMSQFLLNKYCTLWRYETGPQSLQFESPCLPPSLQLVLTPIRHKLAYHPSPLPTKLCTWNLSFFIFLPSPQKEVAPLLLRDSFHHVSGFHHLHSLFSST